MKGLSLSPLVQSCAKTDMKFRLSAGIMIGNHIVPKSISCNSDRTIIHGELFYSKHAEHGAILYLKNKKMRSPRLKPSGPRLCPSRFIAIAATTFGIVRRSR